MTEPRAYSGLEDQLRDVARMATIARFYAHEIEWPKGLTAHQSEEIWRLFLLVGQVPEFWREVQHPPPI
jgi:hypothetical protein